ncbi:hypothetical protein D3C73_1427110 [compost metagenome]
MDLQLIVAAQSEYQAAFPAADGIHRRKCADCHSSLGSTASDPLVVQPRLQPQHQMHALAAGVQRRQLGRNMGIDGFG